MTYRKRLWYFEESYLKYSILHLALTKEIDLSNNRAAMQLICTMSLYNLQFCSYKCKYTQNVLSERGFMRCLFESITQQSYLTPALDQKIQIFDSRAVVGQIERPYMTFTFLLVHVCMYTMTCRNEAGMHLWSPNSTILACVQLYLRK